MIVPIIAIGSMLLSGVFATTQLVSAVKDTTDETAKASLNIGGLLLVGVGAWLIYRTMKKRR